MTSPIRILGLLMLWMVFPVTVHAAVIFTEIMYDLPGTDSGREWVEVTNTGSGSIDVSGYTFFEANSNHALVLVSGTGVLGPGTSAIIANDPTKFKIDWPNYSGPLFDSSFSLSNEGEPLALKDGATIMDSISYDPSAGAAGDGNALKRIGDSFSSTVPTPGTYADILLTTNVQQSASTTVASNSQEGDQTTTSARSAFPYVSPPTALFLEVRGLRSAIREVPLHMSARVTTKSSAVDSSANISWSFGDGSFSTGSVAEKTYHYPGTYLVVVRAIDGTAEVQEEFPITVTSAKVRVSSVSGDGITITNDSNERLDLSGWHLLSDSRSFRIPDGMAILPGASVLLPHAITNLPIAFEAALQYPNGSIAANFVPNPPVPEVAPPAILSIAVTQPLVAAESYKEIGTSGRSIGHNGQSSAVTTKVTTQSHDEEALAPTVAKELAAVGASLPATSAIAIEKDANHLSSLLRSPWSYILLGVILVAASAFVFF